MFEGKTITQIKPIGGLVAGQSKIYQLWSQGSITTVTDSKEVTLIDEVLRDAKRLNLNSKEYLQYMIDEENIFNESKPNYEY